MKTSFTNFSCHAILMLLLSATHMSGIAGAMLADPLEARPPVQKKHAEPMGTAVGGTGNVTPLAKDPRIVQKISCWQNGELLFEQHVIAPKDKVTDIRLLKSPSKSVDVLAMDFKNAFCFIK